MSHRGCVETDTRQRVLESATRLFAERGYRDTTVHEICEQAGANIAAVNYYFGGKEKLYGAVWRHAYSLTRESRDTVLDPDGECPPEQQIDHFVRTRLEDVSSAGPASYFWRILEKEHHDPTPAHDAIIHEVFLPLGQRLERLIARMLDGRGSPRQWRLCLFSLVGTMGFLTAHRGIIRRVFGHDVLDAADCHLLHEHLVRFFLGGIAATRRALSRPAPPRAMAPGEAPAAPEPPTAQGDR